MVDLKYLIKEHSVKNYNKLNRICSPLFDCLQISIFDFYRIEESGQFGSITNSPEFLEYYYETKQYLINPYLSHPSHFRSGYVIAPISFHEEHAESMCKLFGITFLLIILQQKGNCVEAFVFGNKNSDFQSTLNLFSYLDLLMKFGTYFKREANSLINRMMRDGYNLLEAKGKSFFNPDSSTPLFIKNPRIKKFLKVIAPLSKQEIRCLELFKQGFSSHESANILKLKTRTVEFYFDNIKNKLGCYSKRELLNW